MGINCSCQKVESEEETFLRIFSSMNLAEIETKSAYSEFTRCINSEDGFLDYFLFKNFLNKIVGENNYKTAQISYFENLRKMDFKKQNIKRIGSLIIIISKGTKYQKIETLYEHFMKYYTYFDEKSVKDFINDLIEMHTDTCIQSFRENLDYDVIATMNEVYKKLRKRQLLYHIYSSFERVKIRNLHGSPKKPCEKLNTSYDMENIIDLENSRKDDICDVYERYNKSHCDPLRAGFALDTKKINEEEKTVKEFIELSFNHLNGEYMRNWLYEDYIKEKSLENVCI